MDLGTSSPSTICRKVMKAKAGMAEAVCSAVSEVMPRYPKGGLRMCARAGSQSNPDPGWPWLCLTAWQTDRRPDAPGYVLLSVPACRPQRRALRPGFLYFDYRELCGDEEPIQEDQDEDQRDADSIVHVDTPRLVCGTSSMLLLRGSSELFIWCTKDSRGSRLKLKGSGDGRGADILKHAALAPG